MAKLTPRDFEKGAAAAELALAAYNLVNDLIQKHAGHGLVDDSKAYALAIAAVLAAAHELAVDVAEMTHGPYHHASGAW